MRKPFYEIEPKNFLFKPVPPGDDGKVNPEEGVRQWCAFELIRAYGILITDLVFEYPVSIGSKTYRIDIVILRDGKPWAVVECKKRGYEKHSHAMEQAISYADSQNISAEYAVYTNGEAWHVKRKLNNHWLPVPDLSLIATKKDTSDITCLVHALDDILPIFYKLGETISGSDAVKFLHAMQVHFHCYGLFTADTDRALLGATDNLLRILTSNDLAYQSEKLAVVLLKLNAFFSSRNLGETIYPVRASQMSKELRALHSEVNLMLDGAHDVIGADILLLRLIIALLEYGLNLREPVKKYPAISMNVHHALRAYLDYVLKSNLGFHLPGIREGFLSDDLRGHCGNAWNACDNRAV